jgi:hypothetical protein
MKTSNKLLLGLFCLIIASLVIFNLGLKKGMNKVLIQKNILKSHSQIIGNSLYIDSTEVILSIDKNASIADINNYKAKLKEVNIDLTIEKIEYDSIGKIKLLTIAIDCNDGHSGWTTKDLTGDEKIGFYRIYDKSGIKQFDMSPLEFTAQRSDDSTETYVSINHDVAMIVKPKAGLNNQKDKVVLTIDENTTSAELEDYRVKLEARNIDFRINKIEQENSTGKIISIEISVDCNDGFKGTIKQRLNMNKVVGFYRNYNKKSQSPFGMIPFKTQQSDSRVIK